MFLIVGLNLKLLGHLVSCASELGAQDDIFKSQLKSKTLSLLMFICCYAAI